MGLLNWLSGNRKQQQRVQTEKQAFFANMPQLEDPFRVVDGRRLLKNELYMLPKDMGEVSRLDFQHYLQRHIFQGNYLAPLQDLRTILDVGSGTGRWCVEMATTFPNARVVGCDIADTPVDQMQVAPNCQFVMGNVLQGLPFPTGSFDFVHQRALVMAIPTRAWRQDVQELVRLTRAGGWVEMAEGTGVLHQGGKWSDQLTSQVIAVSRLRGIDPSQVPSLAQYMQEAGLINVQARAIAVPLGNWGGRIGMMMSTNIASAAQALKPLVVQQGNLSAEQFEHIIVKAQQEWEMLHTSVPFYIAYGQCP